MLLTFRGHGPTRPNAQSITYSQKSVSVVISMSLPDQRTIHIGFNKKEGIDARRSSTSFDACWNKAWSLRAGTV